MKIAVVGAGKLGTKVIEALLGGDHSITVIDKSEAVLDKLNSHLDIMAVPGDGREVRLLRSLDIDDFDFLIAATDQDEKNIVIASFAKSIGCRKVIARVRDPEHLRQLEFIKETSGIDYIVNPDNVITNEIYKYLVEKYSLGNGIFTSGKASLLEFEVKRLPKLIGLAMPDFNNVLPGMLAVAISRNGKVLVPHGDTVIEENDSIYIMGEREAVLKLSQKVNVKGKYSDLQKVMIIGGGKTGFYLAQKLAEFGISVKIIEKDKERCHYLATNLEDVMILHGDATDTTLLEDENLDEMDAVVTATGFDEENLLLALIAKQHGIEDAIAKVSRESYAGLTNTMGIDVALNPLDISASNILRFVQGSRRIISTHLIQGQAEIVEVRIGDHMAIMDVPIKELGLPSNVLIVAIHRGNELIIPTGSTQIQEDDKVIILSLLSEIPTLEKLLRTKKGLHLFSR